MPITNMPPQNQITPPMIASVLIYSFPKNDTADISLIIAALESIEVLAANIAEN